ncbi:TRAP transporter small permease subunit [Uliginosibacterium sp. 31-16]|uniref:TRAP transporter small permease subunit n=1 Tax=Uliginosibacterium sp. 31-16 TaxID=3068315 RepID=UPI00273E1FDA|nr:TRAP transporter small permease subunit [Uliginosibacterium sp. 31-16]MDP5240533.1 TRAP transporter small permease subunit [Uliginosibacterium sp. 31-16]
MKVLLKVAHGIDALNEWVARIAIWLVLIVTLETAASAIVLKVLDVGSNAFLEIRWYLFSAIFLLGAGYALQKNAHVRIDVLTGRLSRRAQAAIDIIGTLFFLFPVSLMVIWMSWGVFAESFVSSEVSSSAGGLLLWPARLLVPAGFGLLLLQGVSEMIKRLAFLSNQGPDPLGEKKMSAEEELANEIRRQREAAGEGVK